MKYKSYILLIFTLLVFSSASIKVQADVEAETTTVEETTTEQETTTVSGAQEMTTVSSGNKETTVETINVNNTVKVKKTFKLHKLIKLNKSQLSKYTLVSSNTKVAAVSNNGTVKGVRAGTAVITVKSKADNSVYATVTVTVYNYTSDDLRMMSSIIYSEASGECYAGKKAVGIVVMNRVKSKKFPNTISKVIYQRRQFTPTRNGSLNRSLALYDSGKMDKSCIKAAKEALSGSKTVTYKNRNCNLKGYLFFSRYVPGCKLRIQHHQFK